MKNFSKEDLPIEFLNRLKEEIGIENYNKYLNSFYEKQKMGFTVNLNKLKYATISLDDIINKFSGELVYKNDNYAYVIYDKEKLVDENIFPGKDIFYYEGLYYIQEPSAFSVLTYVDIKPNDKVLDLCASPGGKTCQILYNLDVNRGGYVVANEYDFTRAKTLLTNVERMGFDNVIITNASADVLSKKFVNYFDKIIIDAPCSGEGMFGKSDTAKIQWNDSLVKGLVLIQRSLIDEAVKMLKYGGIIIYSTCTFEKAEDEENVQYAVDKYGLKVKKMKKYYPYEDIEYSELNLIDKEKFEKVKLRGMGQFFAILESDESNACENIDSCAVDYKKLKYKDVEYIYPSSFIDIKRLDGVNIIRYGMKVSEINFKKVEYAHALSHNDKISQEYIKNRIELNDDNIDKYLHGESIKVDNKIEKGDCIVTYKGIGVGFGKMSNGVVKNHYPKGLRTL